MTSAVIHENLEPGVIDLEILNKTVIEQGPKGEAGRLAVLDGIKLGEVEAIRLEFLNILKIDHLWMMTSLVKLQLGNNIIEKIENLHMLVNLVELDLSFNNIDTIENLETLVKLEVLTLFENRIEKLENMETLTNLMIFSIGNNFIEDWSNVIYLRQFHQLRSLNLAGNPCFNEPNCLDYIHAFLPQLVYYEYKMISKEQKDAACAMYSRQLETLEDDEATVNAEREAEEKEAEEVAFYSEAFIEYLNSDQLFKSLFSKDEYGQALLMVGDDATEVYEEYEREFALLTAQMFQLGQEQHDIRQEEIRQFNTCVSDAKGKSQLESQDCMEQFMRRKANIFEEIRKVIESMNDDATDEVMDQCAQELGHWSEEFHNLCQQTWQVLMGSELTLFEQMEETNGNFERNLNDIVAAFIEAAQGLFVQMRTLEMSFNEQLTECGNRYLTHSNVDAEMVVLPELKQIMVDKEALNNALSTSHDMHMQLIDSREDRLVTRIKSWAHNICENLQRDEIKRDRTKVMEINHFLDIQREEFDDLQGMQVGAMRDLEKA